jgi:hypothetical protein
MQTSPPTVHWTTYVQTGMVVLSTIGTFVYVWFTYHIMKWAVGQGKATVELAEVSVDDLRRRLAVVDSATANGVLQDTFHLGAILGKLKHAGPDELLAVVTSSENEISEFLSGWEARSNEPMAVNVRQLLSVPFNTLAIVVMVLNAQLFDEPIDEASTRRDRLVEALRLTCMFLLKILKEEYSMDLSGTDLVKLMIGEDLVKMI